MARLLGEARVSILPDGTRFKPEAEAAIKKATANVTAKVALQAQSDRFKAEAKAAAEEVSRGVKATVKIEGDAKGLDAQMAALAARSEALKKSLGNIKISDPNMQAFLKGITKQADELKNSLDKIGSSDGIAKASSSLDRMVAASDRVRAALGKTTFAQEEIASAATSTAAKVSTAASRETAAYTKAEAARADAAQKAEGRIAKARQADFFDQSRKITATHNMYAKLFDDLDKRDKIKVGVNGQYAEAQMAAFRSKIEVLSRKANIRLGLDGKLAEGEALSLREKLKLELKGVTATIRAKTDGGSFGGIVSFIKGRFTRDVENAAGGAGNSGGSSFLSKFGNSFTRSHAIAATVVAGLAALPAAVGAVGVLAGIALGAGLVFGAEKLIKSQVKTLTAQIKTLTSAIGQPASPTTLASQKLAIQNTQATIARLEASKKLTASQQQQLGVAKQRLIIEQQTLAASQAKGQGTAAQQQQLKAAQQQLAVAQQEKAAFTKLDSAVTHLKGAFLSFAVVASKPLIKPFADAVNLLANELNGPLKTAFTKLFTAVGPLVKPVETALLEIVKGILPGLTEMLTRARKPLSDMFIGFGRIVGLSVGQWFREAIPYIRDSGTYLLDLVKILGAAGTFLIKFGGEFAKAFAGSQFKGFGKSLQDMANSILKLLVPAFEGWTAVMAPLARILIDIAAPVLRLLAANPALTKTIFALIAAWMIYSKTLAIVRGAMALLGITTDVALGPWVLLGLAIAAAAYLIVTHWKPISGFFVGVWKAIWSGFIGPMINFFTSTIPHAFSVTINWLKKNWPLLVGIVGGPFAEIAGIILRYHNQIFNVVKSVWGHIENVITGTLKPIASVTEGVWNQVYKVMKGLLTAISTVVKIQTLIVVGLVGQAWRGIKNLTGLVWPWIYNTIKGAWGHIENVTTGTVKPVVSIVVGSWNALKSATGATYAWMFNTIKAAWGHIENATTGIVKPMVTWTEGAWNVLKSATGAAYAWLFNTIKAAWGHIENATTGIVKPMVNWISSSWNFLKNITRSSFNWIHDAIISPLNKAANWIGGFFVRSIKGAFSGLVSGVKAIWNGLVSVVRTPINFVGGIWNKFAGFVNGGLKIFGIGQRLPPAPKFAKGGPVPGYAPGSDTVHAMLSPGEFVINPKAAKAIGIKNLETLNALDSHHPGQKISNSARPAFANGGDVVNDIEKWNGHKYIWGGGANPSTGWDCSSFVNYIVGHDFRLNLPGGGSWAQMTNNGAAHGPVAAAYNNWNYGRRVPWSGAKKGDLAIENNGAHIGFIIQDNTAGSNADTLQGFAARSPATGTGYEQFFPSAFHLERFADDRGFISQTFDNTIGAVLKPLASLALNGIKGLVDSGMNHIPGKGPIPALAKATVDKVMNAAISKLTGNQSNYQFDPAATGPAGVGTSAGEIANGKQLYNYLLTNLFGGHKIAAAGAAASIWGESTWNPFAQGTGGRGLIGWTPPSTISNAAFNGGMATQLPAILQFVSRNGDMPAIAAMEKSRSVLDAANIWGKKVERFGINDVHSQGIALASRFMKNGGLVPSHVFDSGGTLAPGPNMVYNLTGKPEHLAPTGGNGSQSTMTLEIVGGDSDVEQFIVQLIRKYARVKSGGNVQKAFGRNN